MKDKQKGIVFIALIFVIIVLVVLVFSLSLKTDVVKDDLEKDDIQRVLFVIEDENSNFLFSSVMIFNHGTDKAALVNVPGHVGAIWGSLGRVDKFKKVYEDVGIDSFKYEVEKLIGKTIPYYEVISFNNFIKLADFFSGLRIFIPEPIDYVDVNEKRYLLPSGSVNLDGDKLDTYLHYRLPEEYESDVQERYQNVMVAFVTNLHENRYRLNNKNNFKIYSDCFKTNIQEDEQFTLLNLLAQIDTESIIRQTITGSIRNVDGQQLLFPLNNGEFIKEAIVQATNMLAGVDGSLSSHVYVLEIQNGTTIQGLARNTSILFQNASYDVLSAVNADRNDYEKTIIIDHYGNDEVAKMVGEFIHCSNIYKANAGDLPVTLTSEANVDFTIILGRDFNGRYVIPTRNSR